MDPAGPQKIRGTQHVGTRLLLLMLGWRSGGVTGTNGCLHSAQAWAGLRFSGGTERVLLSASSHQLCSVPSPLGTKGHPRSQVPG